MRNAIIIDDRPIRQKQMLGENMTRLYEIRGLSFEYRVDGDFEYYSQYSFIAVHRSALTQIKELQSFIQYCRKTNKYLVLFSGGVPKNSFYDDHFIELNSKTFYNVDRLVDFFTDFCSTEGSAHLLRLVYGRNWKLPYLVEYSHLKWQYGDVPPRRVQDRFFYIEDILQDEVSDDKKRIKEIEDLKNQI